MTDPWHLSELKPPTYKCISLAGWSFSSNASDFGTSFVGAEAADLRGLALIAGRVPLPQEVDGRSVHHHRLLGQARVALKGVFHFFLRWGVQLPGLDLLLEHFCPGAVQVNLFA